MNAALTEYEMAEIRALIKARSATLFDDLERFFSTRRHERLIQRSPDALGPGGYLFRTHAEFIARQPVKPEPPVHRDRHIQQEPTEAAARPAAVTEEKA